MAEAEEKISVEEARQLLAKNEADAVDLRVDEGFEDARVPGARQLDPDDLDSGLDDLPSDRPLIVFSQDGKRAAEVATELREKGREASSVEGGFDAWMQENFPTEPSESVTDPGARPHAV